MRGGDSVMTKGGPREFRQRWKGLLSILTAGTTTQH